MISSARVHHPGVARGRRERGMRAAGEHRGHARGRPPPAEAPPPAPPPRAKGGGGEHAGGQPGQGVA
eukprot:1187817-Prorocentrum_minimum.AAC.8